MNRKISIRLVLYFILLVLIQIPLLHNWVLYDLAFPFPYIGFILLLPCTTHRSGSMMIAFAIGLVIDVFSNTPGIHASAAVLLAYFRAPWLGVATDASNEELDLTISSMGLVKFTQFIFPLILVHHFMLFVLENEGFKWIGTLLAKIFWSALFSYGLIYLVALITDPPNRRK